MDLWLWLSSSNHRLLNVRSPGLNPLALDTRVAGSLTDKDPIAATQRLCCSPLSPSQDSGLRSQAQERRAPCCPPPGSTPQASGSQRLGTEAERHLELIRKCRFSGPAHLYGIDKPGMGSSHLHVRAGVGGGAGGGPPGNSDACSNLRASGYHRRKGAVGKPELNPGPTY